jgi:uncharacterized protein (DUF1330 family)
MKTTMVVYMNISDEGWIREYFAAVPELLAEYGAVSISGGRDIISIEGDMPSPDRIAVIEFPSRAAVDAFMADERYQHYRKQREAGSSSQIFIYSNAVVEGGLA